LFFLLIMNSLLFFSLVIIGIVYSQTCVDLVNPSTGISDCSSRRSLCNNTAYYSFMTTQCPKTCGRCTSTTPTCVDLTNPRTGVSECAQTAYLCNNPAYYSFMTTQCPLTCGRCPSTGK
ncbi:hypothetical protein PRIPAC_81366, partial [Pristionchus pacificus]